MRKILSIGLIAFMVVTIGVTEPIVFHGSNGQEMTVSAATYTTGDYKITSDSGLVLRTTATTSSAKLLTIPYNTSVKVTKVNGMWGYTSYGGKTGWINMQYAKLVNYYSTGSYKVTSKTGLILRKQANTKSAKLTSMPYNTTIKVTKVQGKWGYTSYGGKTGWSLLSYTAKAAVTPGTAGTVTYKPSVPGNFNAVPASSSQVKLTWSKVANAKGYVVYRSLAKKGKYTRIKVLTKNTKVTFTNTGLTVGKTYYYKVRAYRKVNKTTYRSEYTAVKSCKCSKVVANISVLSATKPIRLTLNQSFALRGIVSSTNIMKSVTVGVCTSAGKWKSGFYKVRYPGAKSFNIGTVDSDIRFGGLSKGTYYYRVSATDATGYTKKVINSKFTVNSSTYIWPCGSAANITSKYGYRIHPIYGTSKFHAGIDIAWGGCNGSAIKAVKAGTVIYTGWQSARGNYIKVDHGGGIISLYQHCSSIVGKTGQKVSQGQTVARIGTTGASTGPHLHFEMYVNGSLRDPQTFLP